MLRRIAGSGGWPVFETAEQVRVAVRELTDAVWVLSAMAAVLSSGLEGPFSVDDPAARVLADYGLLEATENGLLSRPGFAEAFGGRALALADGIRSSLGQAATAAFQDKHGGDWGAFADEILIAQGRASAMGGRGTAVFVVPALDGLAERFANGDGVLLDVGVGVAEMACAILPGDSRGPGRGHRPAAPRDRTRRCHRCQPWHGRARPVAVPGRGGARGR